MTRKQFGTSGMVNLSAHPASPSAGDAYFNTVDLVVYTYDGTNWTSAGLPVFIQDVAPTNPPAKYMWWQTNYPSAGGFTLWVTI